jgi:hypothetical protein
MALEKPPLVTRPSTSMPSYVRVRCFRQEFSIFLLQYSVLARVAYRPNTYMITYLKLLDIVTDSRDNAYNLMPKIAAQN